MIKLLKFSTALLITFAAAGIGSLATVASVPTWYAMLEKPWFNPPNWVFGPVWTLLYFLIGVSLYLVWTAPYKRSKKMAYILFGLQLGLNTLWSLVFFGLHMPFVALVVIILLWASIAATLLRFSTISRVAGWLLVPYLLWVSFATVLNAAIATLN